MEVIKMKKINIDIVKYKKGYILETVQGQEVKINNMIFGLYRNTEETYEKENKWYIIDIASGLAIATGSTQKEVLINAQNKMEKVLNLKLEKSYHEAVEILNKLIIDRDKYLYVVISTNKVNTEERKTFNTYKEAKDYKTLITFSNSNIEINKELKIA